MKKSIQLIVSLVCLAISGSSLQAAIRYWDVNDTAADSGQGTGAGTWNTGTTWNDTSTGTGGTLTTWGTGGSLGDTDTAVFSAGTDATSAFEVTVGDGITGYEAPVGQITFEEGTVTVKGTTIGATVYGLLRNHADPTIYSVSSGAAATLDIAMNRTGVSVVKSGQGTLAILQNFQGFGNAVAGTYIGIEEGTYSVGSVAYASASASDNPMGRTLEVRLGGSSTSGTWEYTGAAATFGTHTTLHTGISLGAGGGTIKLTNGQLTIGTTTPSGAPITGTGGLTVDGTAVLRLNTVATYSGNTVINAGANLTMGTSDVLPYGSGKGNVTVNGVLDISAAGTSAQINGLSGSGTVNCGTAAILRVGNNDASSTFSGTIGNSDAVTISKVGSGTLTLSGNCTTTGSVTNTAGGLALTGAGALASATSITLGAGSTFDVSGVTSPPYSIGASQTLTGDGNTATVAGDLTLASGALLNLLYSTNSGNATINVPSGTLTLNANSTAITVTGGALNSGQSYTLISKSGSGAVAGSAGSFTIGGDGVAGGGAPSLSVSAGQLVLTIGPAPNVIHWATGNGTWDTTSANWAGSSTTFSDGVIVQFNDIDATGDPIVTLDTTVQVAEMQVDNTTRTHYTISGTGTLGGNSPLSKLTKAGSGTLTIGVVSTIQGGLRLDAGQLNINSSTALGSSSSIFDINGGAIDNTSGGALTVANNNPQTWDADFTFAGSYDLNLGAGGVTPGANRTVTVNSSKLTVGGVIGGGAVGITKAGAGTLALTGANTFSGNTRVAAGELLIDNANALQNSTLDLTTADSGTVTFGSVTSANIGGLAESDGTTRSLTLANSSSAAVALTVGSGNTVFRGGISGPGSLTKSGSGTLQLGLAGSFAGLSYDGNTTIDAGGTIAIEAGGAFPSGVGKGDLIVNGVLENRGRTINANGLSGTGTIWSQGTFDTTVLNVSHSGSYTYSGVLSRGSAKNLVFNKSGTGTLRLSNANNAIGSVTGTASDAGVRILGGRIVAANAGALGSYRVTIFDSSPVGELEIDNVAVTAPHLWVTNGTIIGTGTGASYGRSGSPQIGTNANVTFATTGSGDFLTITTAVSEGDANSLITVAGPGTVALTSGSTTGYKGKWKLTAGTLRLSDINALGTTASRTIELAGGTLETRVSAAGTFAAATAVSANAAILPNQANPGADHNFGTLSITNVTLSVSPGSQITAASTETNTFTITTLTGNATLNVANNGTRSMKVVLGDVGESGGAQSLTKSGDGTLEITGTGTYTGNTVVNGGTLLVNGAGSIGAGSAVFVNSGATLGGTGTINGPVDVAAGGLFSPGASVGTLTLSSNLTIAGNLFIELDKSLTPSNDVVIVTGTLTNAGTGILTVTNLGAALAPGDTFQLFNKQVLNGQALTIVSAGPEIWTNRLAIDGSIAVLPSGSPIAPATNLLISAVGANAISLGAMGAANTAYDVYVQTNVTEPMSNWWVLGSTNSDGSGLIQFLDSSATNDQRFYRFGQTVTP